ncbi:Nucleolar complex protein 4 [Mactra antiquata]
MRTPEQKKLLSEIKQKADSCMNSRKHANDLLDIISKLQDEDEITVIACIKNVGRLFSHYIDVGEMVMENTDTDDLSKEDQYKKWLRARYQDTVNSLIERLEQPNTTIQELSISVLMKYLTKESYRPLNKTGTDKAFPPQTLFKNIFEGLLSETVDNQHVIGRFQEYLDYDDIRYHTLKYIKTSHNNRNVTDVWLCNVFCVLENVTVPQNKKGYKRFLCKKPNEGHPVYKFENHQQAFSNAWLEYLKNKLSGTLYRKVLTIMHDKIIPNFSSPLLLSDFLIEAYNVGGAISLLALNGLFILIQKHNLHYPEFYERFYALFEPSVFHVKYKARFFYLADTFLSSSYLPSYLVAAFVKRLARICLSAPPAGLLVAVPFIINMIVRHPACKQLVHRPDREMGYDEDPYDHEEPDPAKCRAIDSCLWELKTLQNHYHPDVIKLAKKIEYGELPDMEMYIADKYDTTPDELFERECNKKMKTVAMTFEPPKGLFGTKDNKLDLCWTF